MKEKPLKKDKKKKKKKPFKKLGPATIAVLFDAATNGDLVQLQSHLSNFVGNLADIRNGDGETLLHAAASKGHYVCVVYCLEQGIEASVVDGCKDTPLHKAAEFGVPDVGKLLLEHKSDVNMCNKMFETPLHRACRFSHVGFVELLLDHHCSTTGKNSNGWTALHIGCSSHAREIVSLLIASASASSDVISELLNARDVDGWTGLFCAARDAEDGIVNDLIGAGADVNVRDFSGATPLHAACASGSLACMIALMESGANASVVNEDGETCLHSLCGSRQITVESLRYLCSKLRRSINEQENENENENENEEKEFDMQSRAGELGRTPLLVLLSNMKCVSVPMIQILCEYGSYCEEKDEQGVSAFHYALRTGKEDLAHVLVNMRRVWMKEDCKISRVSSPSPVLSHPSPSPSRDDHLEDQLAEEEEIEWKTMKNTGKCAKESEHDDDDDEDDDWNDESFFRDTIETNGIPQPQPHHHHQQQQQKTTSTTTTTTRTRIYAEEDFPRRDITSLHSMCYEGDVAAVHSILMSSTSPAYSLSTVDRFGRTAFHMACLSPFVSKELLKLVRGQNVSSSKKKGGGGGGKLTSHDDVLKDKFGRTPFLAACCNHSFPPGLLKWLGTSCNDDEGDDDALPAGNLSDTDKNGQTALHYACRLGRFDVIESLVIAFPKSWSKCFWEFPTPLDLAAPIIRGRVGELLTSMEAEMDDEGGSGSDYDDDDDDDDDDDMYESAQEVPDLHNLSHPAAPPRLRHVESATLGGPNVNLYDALIQPEETEGMVNLMNEIAIESPRKIVSPDEEEGLEKEAEAEQQQQQQQEDVVLEQGTRKVQEWCDSIGMSRYFPIFEENGIDSMDILLKDVTDESLVDIGIEKVFHRKKIIREIDAMRIIRK